MSGNLNSFCEVKKVFKVQKLSEVVDEKLLQRILHSFVEATGLRASIIDVEGRRQIVPDNTEDCSFCQLIRSRPEGLERCRKSCSRAGVQAARFGVPYIFRCHAGLIKWAAPLVMNGKHWATILCGQVLMWEPEDFFWIEIKEFTRNLGVDLEELTRAARELEIVSGERVQAAADLLFVVANHIMKTGMITLQQRQEITKQQARLGEEIQTRKMLEHALRRIEKRSSLDSYSLKKEQELLGRVRLGDREGAYELLNELLADILQKDAANPKLIKARILELVVVLSRAAVEGGASLEKLLGLNYQYVQELSAIDSTEELFLWIVKVMEKFIENVYQTRNVKNLQVIQQVTEFIRNGYHRALTMEEIAQVVFLSPCYLSHLFKEELGCTIMEYLTKVRMEEAKKLLRHPQLNVVQIADRVGYSDPSYFTKVFKKCEGITPTEFRQRCQLLS